MMTFSEWLDGKHLSGMELAFAQDAWESALSTYLLDF